MSQITAIPNIWLNSLRPLNRSEIYSALRGIEGGNQVVQAFLSSCADSEELFPVAIISHGKNGIG